MASDIKTSQLCYLICACIRHYFPRRQGNRSGPQLASLRHGRLTPARISPGCPPCLRLGLGRSIIVPDGVIAKQPATGCFVDGWTRLAPYLAVVDRGSILQSCKKERKNVQMTSFAVSAGPLQVVLAHPPASLAPVKGPCQEGIQMIGYSIFKEHEREPPHSITR